MLNMLERFYFARGYWQKIGVLLDTGIRVCPRGSFMKYVNSVLFMACFFDTSYAQDLRHCAICIFLSGWVAYVVCVSFPFNFHMLYLILVIAKIQPQFRHLIAWMFGFKNTFILWNTGLAQVYSLEFYTYVFSSSADVCSTVIPLLSRSVPPYNPLKYSHSICLLYY